MGLAAVVQALVAAGCSAEQIGAAVQAHEAEQRHIEGARREKASARKARWRAKAKDDVHACPRDKTSGDVPERSEAGHVLPPEKDLHTSKKLTPIPSSSLRSEDYATPRSKPDDPKAILGEVLTPETAAGVVEHRRKIRVPLTGLAARQLARQFAETGHPEEAALTMVAQGWRGFKADWFQARAGPPRSGGHHDERHAVLAILKQRNHDKRSHLDESDAGPPGAPDAGDVRLGRDPAQSAGAEHQGDRARDDGVLDLRPLPADGDRTWGLG